MKGGGESVQKTVVFQTGYAGTKDASKKWPFVSKFRSNIRVS